MKLSARIGMPEIMPSVYFITGVVFYQAFPEIVGENMFLLALLNIAASTVKFKIQRTNP
ncbi:TPA: hypothetical protein M5M69_004554 [Citrobacter freundii]|uniref:hypothetical protein n=1 Tax=Citrobacter freundii TaxID=546 RepID=UPI001B83BF88|nr:hypothetical protein [Citrobacter freundii]HBC2002778.1 hypothetical protein [Citrobacter freundii]HBM9448585.1 hypothetical protein [Citrobacter freundii]HCC4675305.1 hypothetical protein [Citrobacter freundii]HCC4806967.1 hypothetical protein [Citrobacter freundii]